MAYKDFCDEIASDLQMTFPSLDIEVMHFENQNGYYYGLSLNITGSKAVFGISVDLRNYYDDLCSGHHYQELLIHVKDMVQSWLNKARTKDDSQYDDYNWVRQHLVPQLICTRGNEELLSRCAYALWEDLAIIYQILQDDGTYTESRLFTPNMLETYGITDVELYYDAVGNASTKNPAYLVDAYFDFCNLIPKLTTGKMYFARCHDSAFGAVCMFYPDFLDQMSKTLDGSFYIIAGIKFELVLIRSDAYTKGFLQYLATNICRAAEEARQQLSESLYYYDAKRKHLLRFE